MAEQTLNEQLTGHEIIEAVLDKLRNRLLAIGYPLRAGDSYRHFSGKITGTLMMHDAGVDVPLEFAADAQMGAEPLEGTPMTATEFEVEIPQAPPNQVRVETGQGVPVLTKGEDGKLTTKKVLYARKDAKKAVSAVLAIVAFCALTAGAQAPAPAPPVLNETTRIAVQAVMEQYNQVIARLRAIEADVRRANPGYHLDEGTLQIVKDVQATPPAKAGPQPKAGPAPAKVEMPTR